MISKNIYSKKEHPTGCSFLLSTVLLIYVKDKLEKYPYFWRRSHHAGGVRDGSVRKKFLGFKEMM